MIGTKVPLFTDYFICRNMYASTYSNTLIFIPKDAYNFLLNSQIYEFC